METITAGTIRYRTKCLSIEAAARFARCLGANQKFTGVEIERSNRAKGEKCWIVLFQPASEARQESLEQRQQDTRAQRAAAQAFTFCADKDSGRLFWWVFSHSSGETYEVSEHSCSCPDQTYNLRGTSLRCKHRLALAAAKPEEIRSW